MTTDQLRRPDVVYKVHLVESWGKEYPKRCVVISMETEAQTQLKIYVTVKKKQWCHSNI
jgi:hypothetical protein